MGLVFQMCSKRSQLDQNKVSVEQYEALNEGVCCKLNLTVINSYHRFFFNTFSPLYLPIINLHFQGNQDGVLSCRKVLVTIGQSSPPSKSYFSAVFFQLPGSFTLDLYF